MNAYDKTTEYISEKNKNIVTKKYKGKTTGKKKEYKAIKGMHVYVKDDGKFDLSKCIDDLTGKEGIDEPAAVCRAAEIAHTGKAHATTKSESELRDIQRGIDILIETQVAETTEPIEEAGRSRAEYRKMKLTKNKKVDYPTDMALLSAANRLSPGAMDALEDAFMKRTGLVNAGSSKVAKELIDAGFAVKAGTGSGSEYRDMSPGQFAPNMLELTDSGRAASIMVLG